MKDRLRIRIVDGLLIFLLLSTPLAYGTVHLPSVVIFSALLLVIFNLFFQSKMVSLQEFLKLPISRWGLFFIIVVLFQLIPLPAFLLKFISPATYKLYSNYTLAYNPVFGFRPLSVYPWATILELLKVLSYGMAFLIILGRLSSQEREPGFKSRGYLQLGLLSSVFSILLHSLCDFNLHIPANAFYFVVILALATGSYIFPRRDGKFLLKMINSIITIGFLIAVFAIIQKFTFLSDVHNTRIYWIGKKSGSAFGPYVSYNHYAGFIEMCTILAIAIFVENISRSTFFHLPALREKILWLASPEANKTLLYLFSSIVMTGSLFLSASRGGIASFSIAVLAFFFVVLIKGKRRQRRRIISALLVAVLLIVLMVIWIGPAPFLNKFKALKEIVHEPVLNFVRPKMWIGTLKIAVDFPLLGTGLGTFSSIFPKYRDIEVSGKFARYPENDYLQLLSEMGLFGLIFILAFLNFYIKLYLQAVKKLGREENEDEA